MAAGEGFYRLVNIAQTDAKSLELRADNGLSLEVTAGLSKQLWGVAQLSGEFCRIYSKVKGSEFSLDIINDGTNNKIHLVPKGNYSGQFWKLN